MTQSISPEPFNRPRRRNRMVEDEEWIRSFLRRAAVGVLATVSGGQPFASPNLFYYDEEKNVVYLHTAGQGRTRTNIEGHGKVCFSAFEMGRLLPAEKIVDYSTEYASVMVFGCAEIVTDLAEMRYALQHQVDKYFPHKKPGRDYAPFTDKDILRTTVYRLVIEQWSAKRQAETEDFPGAFYYGERSEFITPEA